MRFGTDGNGQTFVEWERGPGKYARAWVMTRRGETDWADSRRYLNTAPIAHLGAGPKGQSVDFPILSELDDKEILRAYVVLLSAILGNPLKI